MFHCVLVVEHCPLGFIFVLVHFLSNSYQDGSRISINGSNHPLGKEWKAGGPQTTPWLTVTMNELATDREKGQSSASHTFQSYKMKDSTNQPQSWA